ncbi:MAG: NYN domain-containing protein [Candidatus Acidiferrales bacterium]
MARIAFFIDGFNLYHALDYCHAIAEHRRYQKYKWMSLRKLANLFVGPLDTLSEVLYFTALATWMPEKVERHKLFIHAQQSEGVTVIYGEFKRKDKKCSLCQKRYSTFEEKQTDVNIAIHLLQLAIQDRYDRAVIVSGDTDLIPAIKAVRLTFPNKQIGIMIPIGGSSEDLKKHADFRFKMREHHLASSRFPNSIILSDGTTLECPTTWR